ncbi:MAG: DUF2617 family protein, partial [Planctomycetota bacterium]|nr:DUF2617 family protein [Planctomycetota bacterium]
ISQLRLLLFSRSVHPELFDIYHDHRIVKEGYEAQIWITGLSHLISFHRGKATVTQLIADASAMLPKHGRVASLRLRGEKDHEIDAGPIRHMISFQVETMSPRLYERVHADMTEQASQGGLFLSFSEWVQAGAPEPFTHIDYDAKPGHLHVFAYHAFPDELTLIKTQSIFELI